MTTLNRFQYSPPSSDCPDSSKETHGNGKEMQETRTCILTLYCTVVVLRFYTSFNQFQHNCELEIFQNCDAMNGMYVFSVIHEIGRVHTFLI